MPPTVDGDAADDPVRRQSAEHSEDAEHSQDTGTARRSRLGRYGPQTLVGALIVAVVGSVAGALATSLAGGDDDKPAPPAASAVSPAAASASAPSCFDTTCAGVDPKDAGCADAAVTIADDWVSTMHLEIRFSSRCRVVWGKLTGAQVGDTMEIATSPEQRQRAVVLSGHTKYTPMLPVGRQFSAQVSAVSVKGDPEHGIPAGYTLRVGADHDDAAAQPTR